MSKAEASGSDKQDKKSSSSSSSSDKSRDKEKSKDSEKSKDKDRRDRSREKDKKRDRSSEKDRKRDKSPRRRSSEKDKKRDRSSERDKKKKRSRSSSRSKKSRRSRSQSPRKKRSRSRSPRRRSRSRSRSNSRSRSRSNSRPPATKQAKFDPAAIKAALSGTSIAMSNPSAANALSAAAANPQVTRQARRLYVGNLPVNMGLTEKQLTDFFNQTVTGLGIMTPVPVLSVWISADGTFCFVEFRGIQDCSAAMSMLQGLTLGGRPLRIGRPADYKAPPSYLENFIVGYAPGQFPPPPSTLAAQQALLAVGATWAAGKLSAPPMAADGGFNPLSLLSSLTVTPDVAALIANPAAAASAIASAVGLPGGVPSRVLLLKNMVTAEELVDDEEFKDLLDDVREECNKYGKILQVVIPRPAKEGAAPLPPPVEVKPGDWKDEGLTDNDDDRRGLGVGRIFVLFVDSGCTQKAIAGLNGRTFNERRVEASYYPEESFRNRKLD